MVSSISNQPTAPRKVRPSTHLAPKPPTFKKHSKNKIKYKNKKGSNINQQNLLKTENTALKTHIDFLEVMGLVQSSFSPPNPATSKRVFAMLNSGPPTCTATNSGNSVAHPKMISAASGKDKGILDGSDLPRPVTSPPTSISFPPTDPA
jgi:hypothetical protein